MVYAPGRDSIPTEENPSAQYVPSEGAGGVFANFLQGMTAKYSNNTRGYRRDFFRDTLARLFVQVPSSETNLFFGSVADDHTRSQLLPTLTGIRTPTQNNRQTGGAGTGDPSASVSATPATQGYLDFFIQQAQMPLQEKVDVKETLSDNYVAYFFGQSPPMWSFSGWLFNSVQDDQATNFLRLYLEVLRGTQLARRQKVVSLKIDSYIITGAIVATNFNLQATAEVYVPFQFQMLVKRVATVVSTAGWNPTNAFTPFAADPNAVPYDGRRLRSGNRQAVAAATSPQTAPTAGPVPDRTADARTTQPPAATDPITAQTSSAPGTPPAPGIAPENNAPAPNRAPGSPPAPAPQARTRGGQPVARTTRGATAVQSSTTRATPTDAFIGPPNSPGVSPAPGTTSNASYRAASYQVQVASFTAPQGRAETANVSSPGDWRSQVTTNTALVSR